METPEGRQCCGNKYSPENEKETSEGRQCCGNKYSPENEKETSEVRSVVETNSHQRV